METPNTLQAWWMAIRPRTLAIPSMQVITSLALAYSLQGSIDWLLALSAWLVSLCITIQVNIFNDALDFKKGGDLLQRHGHVKMIAAGLITPKQMFFGGIIATLFLFLCGIPLILKGGPAIALILALSALMGYCYTGGPYPISYLGLSELFVLLFYGFLCIGTVFYLQTDYIDQKTFLIALQMGLLAILPNAVNNFRDQEEDVKTNKRTLMVRFGKRFGRWEITLLTLIPFALGYYWFPLNHPKASLFPLIILPIALKFLSLIWHTEPGKIYNRYFALCVIIQFSFGLLLSLALLI